jgi:hypothetical protein
MLVKEIVMQDRGHNKMPLKKVVTIRRRDTDVTIRRRVTDPNRIPMRRCYDAVYDLNPILDEIEAGDAAEAFLQCEMPLVTDLKRSIPTFLLKQ